MHQISDAVLYGLLPQECESGDEVKQRDLLLSKFHLNGNVLTTAHFAQDPRLACEYRRLLCELRKMGHAIVKTKLERNLFRYTLMSFDATGQGRLAI